MELPGPRKVCFNPHNYYSRAMVIYDRGTLSQVQAYTREKLYTFFFFAPATQIQVVCVFGGVLFIVYKIYT